MEVKTTGQYIDSLGGGCIFWFKDHQKGSYI